jgi:hypothetical protein
MSKFGFIFRASTFQLFLAQGMTPAVENGTLPAKSTK